MDDIDRLLTGVKDRARGLMPLAVYRRLYESALTCRGGTMVEIGTFCGAATISIALGCRSAGQPFELVTADLLRPGVGLQGDSVEAKVNALRSTLAEFGLTETIRFVHGDVACLVAEANPQDIKLVLLDGGGRIESDLALLWDRLASEAVVVIDDIDGRVIVERDLRAARINQKHRLSKLLTDIYVGAGMLIEEGRLASTRWYRKGTVSFTSDEIRLMAFPAYHQLIRATVSPTEFGLPRAVARRLAARAPWLRHAFRRFRPIR